VSVRFWTWLSALLEEPILERPRDLLGWFVSRRGNRGCDVYWGSHGCYRKRGHRGSHVCQCGGLPYRGSATNFYGDDAPANAVGMDA
jgi:hypothetical protein